MSETITVTCYRVEYKSKVTKAKKQAFVLAKTKKNAKDLIYIRESFPIGIKVEAWEEKTIPKNLLLPHILITEFVKG